MAGYGYHTCTICGREVSNSGLASASHGKAHVRRGEAVAFYRYGYGLIFVRPDQAADYDALPGWARED